MSDPLEELIRLTACKLENYPLTKLHHTVTDIIKAMGPHEINISAWHTRTYFCSIEEVLEEFETYYRELEKLK